MYEMKVYKCHKLVKARPMTLGEYNKYQKWSLPDGQSPEAEGYLIEYLDGGKSNHDNHEGYISWSPKSAFDNGYKLAKQD